jgi:hypothetical protein
MRSTHAAFGQAADGTQTHPLHAKQYVKPRHSAAMRVSRRNGCHRMASDYRGFVHRMDTDVSPPVTQGAAALAGVAYAAGDVSIGRPRRYSSVVIPGGMSDTSYMNPCAEASVRASVNAVRVATLIRAAPLTRAQAPHDRCVGGRADSRGEPPKVSRLPSRTPAVLCRRAHRDWGRLFGHHAPGPNVGPLVAGRHWESCRPSERRGLAVD